MSEITLVALPTIQGFEKRSGFIKVAKFDDRVTELKVRGRTLTAKVDGIWHIIPNHLDTRPLPCHHPPVNTDAT